MTWTDQDAAASRRKHALQRRYGITPEQYDRLLAAQGGHCVFCDATAERNGHRLAVDHDPETGRVRGLLCRRHNSALGTLGDNPEALRKVLEYLEHDDG